MGFCAIFSWVSDRELQLSLIGVGASDGTSGLLEARSVVSGKAWGILEEGSGMETLLESFETVLLSFVSLSEVKEAGEGMLESSGAGISLSLSICARRR